MLKNEPNCFTHRALLGWISEFVNRTLPGKWPQIPLDDETLDDLKGYFDLCRDSGYNQVVMWGLFVDRRWPLDIASCVDVERRRRIDRVIDLAHERDLMILSGMGIYSWGFDGIIEAYPDLSKDNRRVMCASVPEAWDWMTRVIDFAMGQFDLDGLNMQSADNGRCTCDKCRELSTAEYHATLNRRVADYIHAHWPNKCLVMDNWGCPFSEPDDLPHLADLSHHLCYMMDHNNSAMQAGRHHRRRLIDHVVCPYGTLAGHSVWPPQRWRNDRWFLPTTLSNVSYVRDLYADGARAVEQFVTTQANPSGEITLRFMGKMLANVNADAEQLLRESVEQTYLPRNTATLDGLVEIVQQAEKSYFQHSGRNLGDYVGLIYLDGGLMHSEEPNPPTYLLDMPGPDLAAYSSQIEKLAVIFDRLRPGIGAKTKADLTVTSLQTILADCRQSALRVET